MPDAAAAPAEERRLGVLFADVSGSTRLFETLGDVAAHAVVELCLQSVRASAGQYAGRAVKAIGDELMCVFAEAEGAISAATDLQVRLEAQRAGGTAIPPMRVGVAYGPVLEDGADVFGDTVNLAARLAALAGPGQVLTNRATVEALPPLLRACCRELYAIELKGIVQQVVVDEVVWGQNADLTLVSGMPRHALAVPQMPALQLVHRGREVAVSREAPEVRIGRDPQSDLVVVAPTTSRRHARIRTSAGNFVLIDESANGTFVRFEGQAELHLRREGTVLVGRGTIGCGEAAVPDGAATIAFVVATR